MAGEVVDGDLDVGEGGVERGVVQQPAELEGKVSACRHTRCMNSIPNPAIEKIENGQALFDIK